jgi:hypothetical protein
MNSMKSSKKIRTGFLTIAFFLTAGCAVGTAAQTAGTTAGGTADATPPSATTRTKTPPPTVTPTASEIPTVAPMVTPSPGPAPDLEIFNGNIVYKNSISNFFFYFMGELRNNSKEPMIFSESEIGLILNFEWWRTDRDYEHRTAEVHIHPGGNFYIQYNSILFPGETGVIAFYMGTTCVDTSACPQTHDDLDSPPEQRGARLVSYQSYPQSWENWLEWYPYLISDDGYPQELKNVYHPETENLTFRIEEAEIYVEFDVSVEWPLYGRYGTYSWMVLYDQYSKIINVLYTDKLFCDGKHCYKLDHFTINGVGSNSEPDLDQGKAPEVIEKWWKPIFPLTAEDARRVEHIRIINELQDLNIYRLLPPKS